MAKNIVLCLDGTGNQVKASGNTNVLRLYQILDLSDPERQVAFYDPGVGTFGAQGTWNPVSRRVTKALGLAFGYGIKTNIAEAYAYLMANYVPGDRVYVFGFSRGAYTARALAGLTYRAGLMRRGTDNLISYLVQSYMKGDDWSGDDWKKIDQFASSFSVKTNGKLSLPIEFMGLWDSVKALGVLRWDPKHPYTRQLPNVSHIRHAVSIDERRRPYREYLVKPKHQDALREVWFTGVHSDVGGTFEDDSGLSDVSLKWMTDRALEQGLRIRERRYTRECTVDEDDAHGLVHKMGRIWALLKYRTRPIHPADARIHSSVAVHMEGDPSYSIDVDMTKIQWDDETWMEPSPLLGSARDG